MDYAQAEQGVVDRGKGAAWVEVWVAPDRGPCGR